MSMQPGAKESIKEIYLAGGCFWGIEAYAKKIYGVIETTDRDMQTEKQKIQLTGNCTVQTMQKLYI